MYVLQQVQSGLGIVLGISKIRLLHARAYIVTPAHVWGNGPHGQRRKKKKSPTPPAQAKLGWRGRFSSAQATTRAKGLFLHGL